MKVYRSAFHDRDHGEVWSWFINHKDAKQHLASVQDEARSLQRESQGTEEVKEIEIPLSKEELIVWLNKNVTGTGPI